MKKEAYSQREMSKLFGWSPAWLRRIELLGLLPGLDSEPNRGREGRVYSAADMGRILRISALRHLGIELTEMKEYATKALELMELLHKHEDNAGEPFQVVFFHDPFARHVFHIKPDSVPDDEVIKIGKLAEWFKRKDEDLLFRIREYNIRMDTIYREINFVGNEATKYIETMMIISDAFVENKLALLK